MSKTEEDDGSKTEDASEKKLKDAQKKGDVPVSKEIGHLAIYGSILVLAAILLPAEVNGLVNSFADLLANVGQVQVGIQSAAILDLAASTQSVVFATLSFIGKALLIMLVAAFVSGMMQGPLVFSIDRIQPKGSKLSPLKGAKKLVGADNLVEFLKSTVKLVVIGGVSLWLVYQILNRLMPGTVVFPEQIMPMLQTQVILTLSWVCGLMIPIVIADYMWKRHSYNKKQKMSMKELKDEHKDSEGDPQVKGKRQQIRRERAQQAIAMSVPKATLILTNPTHYSVALRYERGVDMAPTCVAKGTDLMAARIRKIAHEHEIPVIESRALARALYATVEVDQVIPEAHWPAVAELVGFVMDLKNNVKRKLPVEASLRKD